jgi:hypothetical protein
MTAFRRTYPAAASGRQREFPRFADSCPWPAGPSRRKSASWRGCVLTQPRQKRLVAAVPQSCRSRARWKPLLRTPGRALQRATREVHVCSVICGCRTRQVDVGWDANAIEREARQAVRPRGRIHESALS